MSRSDPLLLWGEVVLEWAFVAENVKFLLHRGLIERDNRSVPAMLSAQLIELIQAQRNERTSRPDSWTLDALLMSVDDGAAGATDSRDRIYAYLGLTSFQGNGRNTSDMLVPDYGKEPLAVFRDVARYCIQESGHLTVLGRGGVSSSDESSSYSYRTGSSWVPRWDVPSQTFSAKAVWRQVTRIVSKDSVSTFEEREMFRAAGTLPAQVMDTQHISRLCLRGIKMDTISWATAVILERNLVISWVASSMAGIWDSMLNCFATISLYTPYQPLGQLCRAFYMVVCAGQTLQGSIASDEPLCHFWAYLCGCYRAQAPELPMYKVYEGLAAGGDPQSVILAVAQKKMFVSGAGHIGHGPPMLQLNDKIWVLYGGATCYVLRNNGDGTHEFIGEAYVHRFMQGEAIQMLKDGLLEETTVTLV